MVFFTPPKIKRPCLRSVKGLRLRLCLYKEAGRLCVTVETTFAWVCLALASGVVALHTPLPT